MAQASIPQDTLKQVMKEALAETFAEQRDLFREVVAETLEDFALAEAIEEGQQTEQVSRERIFDVLGGWPSVRTAFYESFERDLKKLKKNRQVLGRVETP